MFYCINVKKYYNCINYKASKSASNTPAKPKTPGGDRFIPSRMSTNFDISHFKVIVYDCLIC